MGKVIWTEPGLDDLGEVMEFLAKDAPAYAERIGMRIVEAPDVLEEWPRSGNIVPEFGVDHVREIIVWPYRVIYTVRGNDCYIVAVVHGSRDLTAIREINDLDDV
jgi:plasmid stabilization system protein ParE